MPGYEKGVPKDAPLLFPVPAIDRFADLEEHLLQGVGLGDSVPAIEGRADDDCFEVERIEKARKVLERKDTVAVLCVSEIPTIILYPPSARKYPPARSSTMMRYVMMRIPGTHAPTKHQRSPGGIAPPWGGWEGMNQHG